MTFLRFYAAIPAFAFALAAAAAGAADRPRTLLRPALSCADVLGPLEPSKVEVPWGFQPRIFTPRFLIAHDGTVLSRDSFAVLGSSGDPFKPQDFKPGAKGVYLPVGFANAYVRGERRIPGLGTEVKFARMKHAFEVAKAQSLITHFREDNSAALALNRKLGFQFHGTEKDDSSALVYFIGRAGYDRFLRDHAGLTLEELARPRRDVFEALRRFHDSGENGGEDLGRLLAIHDQEIEDRARKQGGFSVAYRGEWAAFPADPAHLQTDWGVIRDLYQNLPLGPEDVVYDLGSGYGRVIAYGAILHPEARFRGVELVQERVRDSRTVLHHFGLANASIENINVLEADLSEGTVFYLFNPFSPGTVRATLERLREVANHHPIRIVVYSTMANWTFSQVSTQPWLRHARSTRPGIFIYESVQP